MIIVFHFYPELEISEVPGFREFVIEQTPRHSWPQDIVAS